MSSIKYPVLVRLFHYSCKIFEKIQRSIKAIFYGAWLGILSPRTLNLIVQSYYENEKLYCSKDYNQQGLHDWEEHAIERYFKACKTLLVAGVGGGREIFALSQLGYQVEGFECNPQLVEFANHLLKETNVSSTVYYSPPDTCPELQKQYDGLIVGWSAYTQIQSRKSRIEFLKKLQTYASSGAPILLSFHTRSSSDSYYYLLRLTGNLFRILLLRQKIQLGDALLSCGYIHYFDQEEVEVELAEAGFNLIDYSTKSYGYAVGMLVG